MSGTLAAARIDDLLRSAPALRATDVHLCVNATPFFRIDGRLESSRGVPVGCEELREALYYLLDETSIAQFEREGDVTTMYRDGGQNVRVHAYRTIAGPELSLRLLPGQPPELAGLNLPPGINDLCNHRNGLVVFTGPTGSGKSTALAALLRQVIDNSPKRIITIEDPVEYVHASGRSAVSQRQVGRDVPSFAAGVNGALRCDPDILLVGEMRRPDTIHAALTAAETGHLVLSTLHTACAADTIDRIIGSFDAAAQAQIRIQLAQVLVAVVCLRLLPRKDAESRIPAAEILIATGAVRNVIREAKTHQIPAILGTSRSAGMQSFEMHLRELEAAGYL